MTTITARQYTIALSLASAHSHAWGSIVHGPAPICIRGACDGCVEARCVETGHFQCALPSQLLQALDAGQRVDTELTDDGWFARLEEGDPESVAALGRISSALGSGGDIALGDIAIACDPDGREQGHRVPDVDDRGHVVHTTHTGRVHWDIAPDGALVVEIRRPHADMPPRLPESAPVGTIRLVAPDAVARHIAAAREEIGPESPTVWGDESVDHAYVWIYLQRHPRTMLRARVSAESTIVAEVVDPAYEERHVVALVDTLYAAGIRGPSVRLAVSCGLPKEHEAWVHATETA